ncbi:hypothetical protein E3N88_29091 [Mikania micrantha]|uniref:RING-type E3 ubiquitin transferase n=1 Tax=Mikania micrantha TaxID=192012 RepID=A0A5N6N2K2_9ASTR|nr:hypothetical protein E3N88_29091 [Mikania micrantha]
MGDDLNLSKHLTQLLSTPKAAPPPPPPPPHPSNMPFLYYGLVVVATAAIVLAVYNLIIVRWCATQYRRSREANNNNNVMIMLSGSSEPRSSSLPSSFRYKKGINKTQIECSVCLSEFEEGEEMRKMPRCNHSFHASCIDMWLYSHSDCPLCRAPVVDPPPQLRHTESSLSEHSRDGLLDTSSAV